VVTGLLSGSSPPRCDLTPPPKRQLVLFPIGLQFLRIVGGDGVIHMKPMASVSKPLAYRCAVPVFGVVQFASAIPCFLFATCSFFPKRFQFWRGFFLRRRLVTFHEPSSVFLRPLARFGQSGFFQKLFAKFFFSAVPVPASPLIRIRPFLCRLKPPLVALLSSSTPHRGFVPFVVFLFFFLVGLSLRIKSPPPRRPEGMLPTVRSSP